MARWRFPLWLMAALLVLVTLALYWPATGHDFVNLDDPDYVTANVHVQGGLTLENVKWACLNPVCCNWHPVTVWSHMLDCQMFGLNPWGHHLTNVVLHGLNAGLVFALLQLMTGATWRSLLVAALFAVHPLHVESVAWVAERKDVLSGFFGLLALVAYARYAEVQSLKSKVLNLRSKPQGTRAEARSPKSKVQSQEPASSTQHPASRITHQVSRLTFHVSRFYLLSLFFFALGLMSKPMMVTWPFVMLMLDYWPLRRNAECRLQIAESTIQHHASRFRPQWQIANPLLPLVAEKLPFFALAALASVVTFVMQQRAMTGVESLPLGARAGNALISYGRYLGKLAWPTDLAVYYPHPGYWPFGQVMFAGGAILGLSVLVWVQRRRFPYLLVGWLWFVGTLVPVIGLVQVGAQAMADRYTYLPSLGVLTLAVWAAYDLTRRWRFQVVALSLAGSAAIVFCWVRAREQVGYWKESEILFQHALAVTKDNWLAHINLGIALHKKGQLDDALSQFQEATRLKPDHADACSNLGVALDENGQTDEAIRQLQKALRLKPDHADAHYNLGNALARQGQTGEAIRQFQEALRLNPDNPDAHNILGLALARQGQADEAIRQFQEALRLNPNHMDARLNLGDALAGKGRMDEAISQFQEAVRLKPDHAQAHYNLGVILSVKGQTDEAISQFQEAIRLKPDFAQAHTNLGYLRTEYAKALGTLASTLDGQGKYADAVRFYQAALKAQPDQEGVLNNLAWLLATCSDAASRNGPEAVRLATRACELSAYGKPLLIGTLAAAQAEAGDFPAAIATAERAAALASALHLEEVAAKNRELIQLYRQGQPFHEKKGGE